MMSRHAKRFIVGTFCAIIACVLAVAIGEAGPAAWGGWSGGHDAVNGDGMLWLRRLATGRWTDDE